MKKVIHGSSRTPLTLSEASDQSDATDWQTLELESQKTEKLYINFKVGMIKQSPLNPRRISLDKAGVTSEVVEQLALRDGESTEQWHKRLESHVEGMTDNVSRDVWIDLIDLATSIHEEGILQPIVLNKHHVIVAGERRWTASQLAGKKTARVIVRVFTALEEAIFRLAENLRRSDLSVAETVGGLRSVVALSLGPCAPDNEEITVVKVAEITGAGRTTAAYYRAFCRLPDNDAVLDNLLDGGYTNIKAAYTDAAERVRFLQGIEVKKEPDESKKDDDKPVVDDGKKDDGSKKQSASVAKVKVQICPAVSRLIDVFAKLDGIPTDVSSEISELSAQWATASDKDKSVILTNALNLAISHLETIKND